jgi:hypothetical protein
MALQPLGWLWFVKVSTDFKRDCMIQANPDGLIQLLGSDFLQLLGSLSKKGKGLL